MDDDFLNLKHCIHLPFSNNRNRYMYVLYTG